MSKRPHQGSPPRPASQSPDLVDHTPQGLSPGDPEQQQHASGPSKKPRNFIATVVGAFPLSVMGDSSSNHST